MDLNPISYAELDAFCRRTLIEPSAWEADLIMRLDDAALAAMRGASPGSAGPKEVALAGRSAAVETVAVDNVVEMKAMLTARAMATRAMSQKKG